MINLHAYLPAGLVDALQQIRLAVGRSDQVISHNVIDIQQIMGVLASVLNQLFRQRSTQQKTMLKLHSLSQVIQNHYLPNSPVGQLECLVDVQTTILLKQKGKR